MSWSFWSVTEGMGWLVVSSEICSMTASAPSWCVLRTPAFSKEVFLDRAECSWHFGVTLTSGLHSHQETLLGPLWECRLLGIHQGLCWAWQYSLCRTEDGTVNMMLNPDSASQSFWSPGHSGKSRKSNLPPCQRERWSEGIVFKDLKIIQFSAKHFPFSINSTGTQERKSSAIWEPCFAQFFCLLEAEATWQWQWDGAFPRWMRVTLNTAPSCPQSCWLQHS